MNYTPYMIRENAREEYWYQQGRFEEMPEGSVRGAQLAVVHNALVQVVESFRKHTYL